MAQGSEDLDDDRSDRAGADEHERWPNDAPTAAVARVVLELDEAITLKRRAAAAWLTAHGDAVPLLPVKPTRLELAVVIALAEIYGAALINDARLGPVIDFITDVGAVKLVQRVMYGARPEHNNSADFDVTAYAAENARLAELLREARTAFEFLCATWPEAFMAQASEALAQLGLPTLRAPAPPSTNRDRPGRDKAGDDSGDAFDGEGDDA
ncbi:hypothetical protein AWB72_05157 [Caballeronia concitans]|uniref:Uncharacterized protein n=1 Tax=Caballeronia concitans TaxID=1777133 RepID=A0A658R4Y3_9BURK|nr:hypothetical protein AWB72_05157 [Caballeronia concitans]